MKIKSQNGYSLIEIGIALIIVGIFMVTSVTLLSASNENYRIIEQKNIALSYAIKTIEAMQLPNRESIIQDIKNKASGDNNMIITTNSETILKDGNPTKAKKLSVNVEYHIKSNYSGSVSQISLQTLFVED